MVEYFKLEDERWKYLLECINKYREIEEEKQQVETGLIATKIIKQENDKTTNLLQKDQFTPTCGF